MQELVEMISSSNDENEIIELEVYKLTMYSIETYARKFKADGITQDQMNSLFTSAKNEASDVSTTSDKTEQLKKDVMNRFDAAQAAIENAFRE